jgi:hypothetical protein
MTVRVDTLDALVGSPSRLVPVLRTLSEAAMKRVMDWWEHRSALVMSDEWMQEFRRSNRDRF